MNRRTLLRQMGGGTSVGLVGILAGCSGGGSSSGGGSGNGTGDGSSSGGSGGGTSSGAATTSGGGAATTSGGGAATTSGQGQMTTTGGGMTTGGGTTQFSATVNVFSTDKFGDILVGPNGLSLYLLTSDSSGKSTCSSGKCTNIWPPLTAKNPTKSDGVTAKIGTFKRSGGSTQVMVAGHPLYNYQPDQKPGDTMGQEIESFGGEWYLLKPDGSKAEQKETGGSKKAATSSNTTTTSGSGSGSGY